MQTLQGASGHEARERVGAPLNQHAHEPEVRQRGNDIGRRQTFTAAFRQRDVLGARNGFRADDDAAGAVARETFHVGRHTAVRIDDHACGLGGAGGKARAAHGELWVIGDDGAYTDDDRIHQCAQSVQMNQCGRAIDVVRMAAGCGDSPVQGLADLADHQRLLA